MVKPPPWLKPFVVATTEPTVDGLQVTCFVTSHSLILYPFFAGTTPEGGVFISEDWPEEYRQRVIEHEYRCNVLWRDRDGRCQQATRLELEGLEGSELARFIALRLAFYHVLLAYEPKHDSFTQIAGTADHLSQQYRQLLSQLSAA